MICVRDYVSLCIMFMFRPFPCVYGRVVLFKCVLHLLLGVGEEGSLCYICLCLSVLHRRCLCQVPFVIVCSWVCLHSYDGVVCCRIHSLVLFLCRCHLFHIVGRHDIYNMSRYVHIS